MNIKKFIASITTVALVGTTMATMSVGAEVQSTYNAYVNASVGTAGFWQDQGTAPSVEIKGDGQYYVELSFEEPTEANGGLLLIDTDINPYDFIAEGESDGLNNSQLAEATGITLSIDSIEVDGNEIAYNGPSDGAYVNEANNLRLNVYNVWGNSVEDIDMSFTVQSSIKVTFTVAGLDEAIKNFGGDTDNTDENTDPEVTKSPEIGDSENKNDVTSEKDKDKDKDKDTTTVTTTDKKTDTPSTGDAGLGAVAVTLAVAGLSALALKKKD